LDTSPTTTGVDEALAAATERNANNPNFMMLFQINFLSKNPFAFVRLEQKLIVSVPADSSKIAIPCPKIIR